MHPTYIRRLLKPINSKNHSHEDSDKLQQQEMDAEDAVTSTSNTTKKNDKPKKEMPRRSPRNHNSTRAADTEIAAKITTLHNYEVQHGPR